MPNLELSVVIPAYNEAAVIAPTIEAIDDYLARAGLAHEILVVDDGSLDETAALARALAGARPALRVLAGAHQGKGAAIKQGVLDATGRYLLFLDADHSTRIEEIQKCLPWLREGCEVVIGSRKIPGAVIRVHQPPLREWMGKGFTWLTNTLLGVRVTDFTCGFKCFQTAVAQRLFRLQRIGGWGFDAELVFLADRLGYRIKEVPVEWANDARTKVRLVRDSVRSFAEVVQIRLGARRGWYADRGEAAEPCEPLEALDLKGTPS